MDDSTKDDAPTVPVGRHAQTARSEHTSHDMHAEHGTPEGHGPHHGHSAPGGHDAHADRSAHADHSAHASHATHESAGGHDDHASHGGHGGHGGHGDHVGQFRRLFWVMLALAVPVVAFSPMFAMLVGYSVPDNPVIAWIPPVLGTVIYLWGGRPFLTGAVQELRARKPGMMLLIALAITVAFIASWGATLGVVHHELDFWWELALLVVIMLLGHWIEMRSLADTTSALDSLAALLPDEAERVVGDAVEKVAPADLRVGDVVLVRPGGRVPADVVITEGSASMDESMITGESRTVARSVGDTLVAGTVATDSGVRARVTAVGEDTALAGISRLVSEAQLSSSRAQRIADRAAGWLFWFALIAGVLTAIIWTAIGMPDAAVVRTITVLVIACPHALGLAIPLVLSIATERAARGGILVKDRLALERMRGVDTVLFDKTGTLTEGAPAVTELATTDGFTEDEMLRLAASAEHDSEHPLARAIVQAAADRSLALASSSGFTSNPAEGVRAVIDGKVVHVGGPKMLANEGAHEHPIADEWRTTGSIILHVLVDGTVAGALRLADAIRPASRDAVAALHKREVEVVMITGDAEAVAASVAAELGITRFFAGVRPEDKAQKVGELIDEGRVVAMVGDGVNDAPALARADVGIAIGAGTDVAIASAGVILASDDPRSVVSAIDLSRASYRKMTQNLWWAAGYNLLAVPLAAGVLAPIGFILPMSVGAVLMSLSTIVVALNAQLLRRMDLRPERISDEVRR